MTAPAKSNSGAGVVVLVVGILLLVGMCAGNSNKSSSSSSNSSGSYSLACEHFANIARDVDAGLLTDAELRTKIGEVRSSATDSKVYAAATELYGALTQRSKTGAAMAYGQLKSACHV